MVNVVRKESHPHQPPRFLATDFWAEKSAAPRLQGWREWSEGGEGLKQPVPTSQLLEYEHYYSDSISNWDKVDCGDGAHRCAARTAHLVREPRADARFPPRICGQAHRVKNLRANFEQTLCLKLSSCEEGLVKRGLQFSPLEGAPKLRGRRKLKTALSNCSLFKNYL